MYDWQLHIVADGEDTDGGFILGMCDAHTHGLDKYGSLEIQFVLFYPPVMIGEILNDVAEAISKGLELHDGMLLEGFCDGDAKLKVFKTKDAFGEDIFRLIMPDGDYKYPEESEEKPYCLQYENPYMGNYYSQKHKKNIQNCKEYRKKVKNLWAKGEKDD